MVTCRSASGERGRARLRRGLNTGRLSDCCADVVVDVGTAIDDELSALATDTGSAIHLRNGRHVGTTGADGLWSFEFDGGLPVPPETPARLTVPDRDPLQVTILAVGDLDLVLGMRDELGHNVARARLSAEPWYIYDRLRGRLAGMLEAGGDTALLEALLDLRDLGGAAPSAPTGPSELMVGLGADQHDAVGRSTEPGLRFVWGPPGTGKTNTLAAAVRLLVARDGPHGIADGGTEQGVAAQHVAGPSERVLVVAHANAAVDVAMARVADMLAGTAALAEGRVLRVGTPQLDVLLNRPDVIPDQIIARQQPDLVRQQEELRYERRLLSTALKRAGTRDERAALAKQLDEVRARQADNERRLREARAALVQRATVIGATLSKLVLDDGLWRWPSTTVIVDEASMAGLPYLVALALRGASTLACFGDFRQLPPIAVSDTDVARTWLARDVFQLGGVDTRIADYEPDPRLAILRTQYRMGGQIAGAISDFAYYGLLTTAPAAQERAQPIAAVAPAPGQQIVVVDTSSLGGACLVDADATSFSRYNLLGAALASSLGHQLVAGGMGEVGIVTPYRAQARVVTAMTREEREITAATTHKFQGSERDAIIIDLVDAFPQEGPSRLTGRDPDLATRLLNVGASRARGKLVVLADVSFMQACHATTSPARALLDIVQANGAPIVDARDLLRYVAPTTATWHDSWEEAIVDATDGTRLAVDVSVPGAEFASGWLAKLADRASAAGKPTIVRAPVQVAVALEDAQADLRLRTLGAAPLAFIGDETLVTGGTGPDGPAVCVTSPAVVAAVRRLVLPAG